MTRRAPATDLRLSEDAEARIDDLQRRYPDKRSTLLHVLWEVQRQEGWISQDWMEYAAARCGVSPSHVLGVVGFYTMFHMRPPGRHHVQVCRNISCHIMGARRVIERVREKLGLASGEVSADGRFSFEEVECMAACSWAPMMAVNGTYHENLTPDRAAEILEELE